jgi:hypothetical protein
MRRGQEWSHENEKNGNDGIGRHPKKKKKNLGFVDNSTVFQVDDTVMSNWVTSYSTTKSKQKRWESGAPVPDGARIIQRLNYGDGRCKLQEPPGGSFRDALAGLRLPVD